MREEFLDTDPITLTEASRMVLRGVVSVSALRAEIKRGNLAAERIGKNIFTTPAAIREMRAKCRVKPSLATITSEPVEASTALSDELAALNESVKALKRRSASAKGHR